MDLVIVHGVSREGGREWEGFVNRWVYKP